MHRRTARYGRPPWGVDELSGPTVLSPSDETVATAVNQLLEDVRKRSPNTYVMPDLRSSVTSRRLTRLPC